MYWSAMSLNAVLNQPATGTSALAISLIMAVIIMLSMWLTRKVDTDPAANGKGA